MVTVVVRQEDTVKIVRRQPKITQKPCDAAERNATLNQEGRVLGLDQIGVPGTTAGDGPDVHRQDRAARIEDRADGGRAACPSNLTVLLKVVSQLLGAARVA